MGKYAKRTVVSPEKTQQDIQRVLKRYEVDGVILGHLDNRAYVEFAIKKLVRVVRIFLTLPTRSEYYTEKQYEQGVRQAWRALYLVVKAKLESVESKIETFDEAFMPHIVMPGAGGQTIGQRLLPDFQKTLETGEMPKLLPGPQ